MPTRFWMINSFSAVWNSWPGPNRGRILIIGLAAGAGIGYGLFLLRRKFHLARVDTFSDIQDLVHGAMLVSVPRLGDGLIKQRSFRVPWREVALGGWILFCVAATVYLMVGQSGALDMPTWVRDLIGIPA